MVCGKSHICHELVLYQNVNDHAYSTPFIYDALDVLILGIGLYHNTFSHICVQRQHYPEHGILYMLILFYCFFYFPWSMTSCFQCSLDIFFWNYLSRLT